MLIWLIGWTEQHHLLRATWHHWEGAVAGFQTLQQGALGHKSWLTELSSYAVTKEAGTSVTKRPGLWQWQLMIYSSCIWFAVSSCYTSDVYVSFWDFFSFYHIHGIMHIVPVAVYIPAWKIVLFQIPGGLLKPQNKLQGLIPPQIRFS